MSGDPVLLEVSDAVAKICLNRPKYGNAITRPLLDHLNEAIDAIEVPGVRVVVISGAGRAFCSGSDIQELTDQHGALDRSRLISFVRYVSSTIERLTELNKPVIASVHGHALASGLEIMMACDLVIAERAAKIGEGHANYGMLPGAGGSARLARIAGPLVAKYLAYTGQTISAADLVPCGLVNEAVPPDQLNSYVDELALTLADKSHDGLAHMKRSINDGLNGSLPAALQLEREALEAYVRGPDIEEGFSALRENRKPRFPRLHSP